MRIVTQTMLPVHIIHPSTEIEVYLRPYARGRVIGIRPEHVGLPLLDRLRLLKLTAASETARDICAATSDEERAVLRLVAEGQSDMQIAEELGNRLIRVAQIEWEERMP